MMWRETLPVVGVTFEGRQVALRRLLENYWEAGLGRAIELRVEAEPRNQYDPNAVAVVCVEPEDCAGRIGYVAKTHNEAWSILLRAGYTVSVSLLSMGRAAESGAIGLSIELLASSHCGAGSLDTF